MKRLAMILLSMVFLFTFGACGAANNGGMYTSEEDSAVSYTKITAEEAKELMDTETDYIILQRGCFMIGKINRDKYVSLWN